MWDEKALLQNKIYFKFSPQAIPFARVLSSWGFFKEIMINKGLFASATGEWSTPQDFFDRINLEFDLQVDVCATKENTKCKVFFSKEKDGLKCDWSKYRCWLNPPYGREISAWVKKASESNTLVVGLLPARTDTRWFWDYVQGKAEIRFIRGRLKFGGCKNSAPFPSLIAIWRGI